MTSLGLTPSLTRRTPNSRQAMQPKTYREAMDTICRARCLAIGVDPPQCMEICGEAGPSIDNDASCGQIAEALGFEPTEEDLAGWGEGGA